MYNSVTIQLKKDIGEPMYVQLYKELKKLIEEGKIENNSKLPPIRKIAGELGINSSTVINAYKLLENSGFAHSQVGSGTYVRWKSTNGMPKYRNERDYNTKVMAVEGVIDFADSAPDPQLFPAADFKLLMDEILDRDGALAFNYTEVKGYKPLRECLSEYMAEDRIYADPEDIYVISGAQQGIDIIAKVLIDYGDIIITERPTYTGVIAASKSRGAEIIDIAINEDGMDISELEDKLKTIKPKFIYLMPNFQNPTGYSYSQDTKEYILSLSEKYNFYIIEDDYLSEIYYNSRKPATLKSMDKNDRVVYIKSFSKILMPGARLGFLIVPKKLQDRVLAVKHFSDISSSGFMQRVFNLFLRDGMLDKYTRDIRDEYYKKYAAITDFMDKNLSGIRYYKPEGGVHLWIETPQNITSNMLYSECLSNGVLISPGSVFYFDNMDARCFRLTYASLEIDRIIKGISIIKETLERMQGYSMLLQKSLIL